LLLAGCDCVVEANAASLMLYAELDAAMAAGLQLGQRGKVQQSSAHGQDMCRVALPWHAPLYTMPGLSCTSCGINRGPAAAI
jgi:hypothetical protein